MAGHSSISGYLIEKFNHMGSAYTCRRLVDEAKVQGIDLRIVGIHDTVITQEGLFNEGTQLAGTDFVINRYKWGKVKDEINRLAGRSYNPLDAYNIYINKHEQVRRLRSDAFVIPRYVSGTGMTPFALLASRLGCPFVAKGLESSMGEQICLVEKEEDLAELAGIWGAEKEWLFEEFISCSVGRDIRFFSIRGMAVAGMIRRSNGDFRANVALGASVEPCEITEGMRKIAADVYRQTGLDFLGGGVLFGEEKPYFCEINVMPGIEGMETATGVNVAKMMIDTIRDDFAYGQERS